MSEHLEDLADLLLACRSAHQQLEQAAVRNADADAEAKSAARRLETPTLRPLRDVIGREPHEAAPPAEPLTLRELAIRATALRARASAPPSELLEATAALQTLALQAAERDGRGRGGVARRAGGPAGRSGHRDRAREERAVDDLFSSIRPPLACTKGSSRSRKTVSRRSVQWPECWQVPRLSRIVSARSGTAPSAERWDARIRASPPGARRS